MIFRSFAKIISISLFSVVLLSNLAFANLESAQELIENQSLGLSQESEEIKNLLHSTLMDNRYELNGHMLESIKHLNSVNFQIKLDNIFKLF